MKRVLIEADCLGSAKSQHVERRAGAGAARRDCDCGLVRRGRTSSARTGCSRSNAGKRSATFPAVFHETTVLDRRHLRPPDYAERRSSARCPIDGGTASERGARDHVQMLARIQGAPNKSEIPTLLSIDLPCLPQTVRRLVSAAYSQNLHNLGALQASLTTANN